MGTVLTLVRISRVGGGVAAARLFHQFHPQLIQPDALDTI